MCGIIFSNKIKLSNNDLLRIKHRGPDYQSLLHIEQMNFAHVRLKIQDLSDDSNQPFTDGKNVMLFNGEVYNAKELCAEFNLKSNYKSDTSVLFEGLSKYGTDFMNSVNGIYAIVYFCNDNKSISFLRDPAGVKNLYYYIENNKILICSEIKSFSTHKSLLADNDFKDIFNLFRFIPSPHTVYRDIKKLRAGELIKITLNHSYDIQEILKDKIEYKKSNNFKIGEILNHQMISDVSISTLVSSGVDSSVLSAGISKGKCYHANNKSGKFSELDKVKINKKIQNRLHVLNVDSESNLEDLLQIIEEPVSANSIHFMDALMSNINETVIFAGQGGDELFFGYNRYRVAFLYDLLKFLRLLKFIPKSKYKIFRILKQLSKFKYNITRIGYLINTGFDGVIEEDLIINKYPEFKMYQNENLLSSLVNFDREYSLPDELLMYTDKISMYYSKEVRVPLLDLNIKRLKAYSLNGIINIIFPKIYLRFFCWKNGVLPSYKKIGFEFDNGISTREFQNKVWTYFKNK